MQKSGQIFCLWLLYLYKQNKNDMKKFILFSILLISFIVNGQKQGINLIHNKRNDTVFLEAKKRIKIKTTNRKTIAGRFIILNDSTISIKNQIVPIDSIVKIRKASTFSAILKPVCIYVGALFLTGGLAGVIYGNYIATIILVPPGLPLFILPQTTSKHKKQKWRYEIVNFEANSQNQKVL